MLSVSHDFGGLVNEVRNYKNQIARAIRDQVIAQRSHSEPRSLDSFYNPKVTYAVYPNEVERHPAKLHMGAVSLP